MISTEEGEGGVDGVRARVGVATGVSLSSNNRQLFESCCVSARGLLLVGGVDMSLDEKGVTGIEEVRRRVLGVVASFRGVVRGDGFDNGLCTCDANLQGGT